MRIPFTNIDINLWYIFVGGLGMLARLQGSNAGATNNANCLTPTGNYLDSCTNPKIIPYFSSDPLIPPTCQMTTTCNTIYETMAPVKSTSFLPSGILFEEVSNNNGTLMHAGEVLGGLKKLSESLVASNQEVSPCFMPSGSFANSCKITLKRYISPDKNLENTSLCSAEANCKTLKDETASTVVYYNIKSKEGLETTKQKIENCDGTLVVGSDDHRCDYPALPEQVREIASRESSKSKSLSIS